MCPARSPTPPQTIGVVAWKEGEERRKTRGAAGSRQGLRAPGLIAAARGPGCASTPAAVGSSPEPARVCPPAIPISPFTTEKKKTPNVISALRRQPPRPTRGEFLQKGEKIVLANIHQTGPKAAGAPAELISSGNGSAVGCGTDSAATQQTS